MALSSITSNSTRRVDRFARLVGVTNPVYILGRPVEDIVFTLTYDGAYDRFTCIVFHTKTHKKREFSITSATTDKHFQFLIVRYAEELLPRKPRPGAARRSHFLRRSLRPL